MGAVSNAPENLSAAERGGLTFGGPPADSAPAREVRLTLAAVDAATGRDAVEALARDLDGRLEVASEPAPGGFADSRIAGRRAGRGGGSGVAEAGVAGTQPQRWTVRVPVDQLDVALGRLRALGESGPEVRNDVDLQAELAAAAAGVSEAEQTEQQLVAQRAAARPGEVAGFDRALGLTRDKLATLRANHEALRERQRFVTIVLTVFLR
jgi:hypothetical protein